MAVLAVHTRTIVALGYHTEIRCGEIINLPCDEGDFKIRRIRLEAAETKDREKGKNPESVIMKTIGHSTKEMFLRYDRVDEADTRKAVDQTVRQVPSKEKRVN